MDVRFVAQCMHRVGLFLFKVEGVYEKALQLVTKLQCLFFSFFLKTECLIKANFLTILLVQSKMILTQQVLYYSL